MSIKAVPGYAENGGSKYVMNKKENGTYERKKISLDAETVESNTLPKVSSHDNGKVLGVKSGKWQKVDAPSGLPAVTGSDNGKFLGVNEGEWSVVSAPSGGGVLNVTDNWVFDDSVNPNEIVHTLNKTYQEIKTAYLAGMAVIVTLTASSEEDSTTIDQTIYGKVVGVSDVAENDVVTAVSCYVTGINGEYVQLFDGSSLSDNPSWHQVMS